MFDKLQNHIARGIDKRGVQMVLRIEESDLNAVLLAHKDAIGSLSVGHGVATR